MSISKIKESARKALEGKWGKGACITLAYFTLYLIIGFVTAFFEENSLMANLLYIVTIIIQVPLTLGLVYAFIKLKRNEEIKAFDFLELGFSNFGKSWKLSFRIFLKMILPVIGLSISIVLMAFAITSMAMTAILGGTTELASMVLLLSNILIFVSVIGTIVMGLLYSLTFYIAYDNPDMTALEAVNESARMMKGNRGKMFLLELSFIGWAILAILTLGIGSLWLATYIQVAEICFYEHLLEKDKSTSNDENEVIIES